MKVFVVDVARCNGCHNCQIACKDEHCGNSWMPYAKSQPDTGHFWLKMQETEHGQIPKVKLEYKPLLCMHCDNPPCAGAGDAVAKREDGLVALDPARATDKTYVDACPYGAIYWNEMLGIAQKCTGCAHLVDEGQLPHCVDVCPTGALRFGEESDFAQEIEAAEVIGAEFGTKPRVYYLNMPKFFISGDVWDSNADEIIEGAKVTLSNEGGVVAQTTSDDFGDFWFRKLTAGTYDVKVEADSFATVEKKGIVLDRSLNIGDFALGK
ncbi:MAG: 4Fe-4S dicluster domain-containing protein [Coriobacteriia bacterium]